MLSTQDAGACKLVQWTSTKWKERRRDEALMEKKALGKASSADQDGDFEDEV